MRDNDTAGGETGRDLAQAARDVLIGQAMKAVVEDTRVLVFPGSAKRVATSGIV